MQRSERGYLPGLVGALLASLATLPVAQAEMRFRGNVRIGGHEVSNRTVTLRRRAVIHL